MSTNKHIDKICCVILTFTVILSVFAMGLGAFDGLAQTQTGYELKLFDDTKVHTINIVMDDWNSFVENCENEEYASCSVIIDNESFKNVAIRAKGNTSLSSVSKYGNDRYSFKIEFDHYERKTYYGLDKLSLNNLIQDNTYMKDYLVYTLMREHGVSAPLCSFVNIKINGETFGLYLAVEGVEDSFLSRNYGFDFGELYKPDSMGMGGGRGNGKEFTNEKNEQLIQSGDTTATNESKQGDTEETATVSENKQFRNKLQNGEMTQMPNGEAPQKPFGENGDNQKINPGGGHGNGSSDVLLQYTDDNFSSYQNIFDNAKTDITDADKSRLINSLKALNDGTDVESCVDVESVIRYFVVHNFVCNFDSYTGQMIHNYYLYEKYGIMSMIPWDYNLAFGGFMSGSDATNLVNFPIDSPVSGGDVSDRPMIAWIFSNDEYKELYHQYMNEFISEVFESGYFEEKFNSVSKMITPYVREEENGFCTYEEFAKGISALKSFCELRAESVKGQLDGTIPSTSDAQRSDNSSLIDAKNLNINDMGSMGMGGGGSKSFDKTGSENNNTKTEETTATQNETTTKNSGNMNAFIQLTSNSLSFFNLVNSVNTEETTGVSPRMWQGGMGERPQMPNGEMPQMPNGEMPNGETPQTTEESSTEKSEESTVQSEENSTPSRDENSFNKDRFPAENQQETTFSGEVIISTLLSIVVLVGGLVFAKSFRRYKV